MLEKTIFWAGDSTVKENKIETYPQTGIAQAMDRFLKMGVRIVNMAENGRSTKSFLAENRFKPVIDLACEGDFVFIQFGHNDAKKEDPVRYTTPEEYKQNLMYMANKAREKGAIPIFITPCARRKFENGVYIYGGHKPYHDAMCELAIKENILCIDLTATSEKFLDKMGEQKTEKLFMNLNPNEVDNPKFKDGQIDNTHFTYYGAVLMANLLSNEMRKFKVFESILFDENNT